LPSAIGLSHRKAASAGKCMTGAMLRITIREVHCTIIFTLERTSKK
jgi:hypothetical protein